jgi:hypothetical protein
MFGVYSIYLMLPLGMGLLFYWIVILLISGSKIFEVSRNWSKIVNENFLLWAFPSLLSF